MKQRRPQRRTTTRRLKAGLVYTAGRLLWATKSPEDAYQGLFDAVQARQVFADGKTFVDLVPRRRRREIMREYLLARRDPDFDLGDFVNRHFYEFAPHRDQAYTMSPARSPRQHVSELWPQLLRRNRKTRGSLLALPHEYIVPGGRFSEQFYWDSYFIMLGLAADGRWRLINGMMQNYVFMLRTFGYIPTANRSYFLSRSQPPFFSQMVRLVADHRGRTATYFTYLPHLLTEYRFWMKGRRSIKSHVEGQAALRVVRLPDGTILNRFYDNKTTPRPESQREDVETARTARSTNKQKVFLDLRAGAESGWDFSSRWFRDPQDIRTIHTTDIVPVDLNCLLYDYECLIADIYRRMKQPLLARRFQRLADQRAWAINQYCWDDQEGWYYDYDFRLGQVTGRASLAAVFALYTGVATQGQASRVADRLRADFLRDGGLVSSLVQTGQQWDAPNGWAPLQWVAIQGLRRYGLTDLASEIRRRWLASVETVFSTKHKMIEKYDVMHPDRIGGGGEYPLQDGFGWTNGVYAALYDEQTVVQKEVKRAGH